MNSQNNSKFNSTCKNLTNAIKPKIINDNPKLNVNKNKISFNKKSKKEKENLIKNYKESNIKKFSSNSISKKLDLGTIPVNQTKMLIFKPNKDYSLFNSSAQSKSNEKRKNKFLFGDNKETPLKNFNSSRNNNKINLNDNKYLNSFELKEISNPKINRENKLNNLNLNNNSKASIKLNKELNSNKEFINKSNKETYLSINKNENDSDKLEFNSNLFNNNTNKINIKDMKSLNIYNNTNKDMSNKNKLILTSSTTNHIAHEAKIKSLTKKEKAFYILSKSKVLNLRERIIFSKSTKNISSLISIKDILKSSELSIKNKIKEFEIKLNECKRAIESPFSPSKISSISLNLIMKEDEDEFKNIITNKIIKDENEKYYYFIYIQLLLLLLGENVNEDDIEENGINILYKNLAKKDYIYLKDYLHKLFIAKELRIEVFKGEIIDKFNEVFEELPDIIKYDGPIKNIRFISFSYFILSEAYNYFKNLKQYFQIKNEIQGYIDGLNDKLNKLNKI